MRVALYGGFGEKGRTCVGVESGDYRLLLDAGVKTGARGTHDYYPALSEPRLREQDAIVVTHGHEDHVAALGWCIARGFGGRIFMTPETRREADLCLQGYATPDELERFRRAVVEPLTLGDAAIRLGPLSISTGRSGHIAGGVWCRIDDGDIRFDYCGDVAPASPIFPMDPMLPCEAIAIDASYGDDDVSARERSAEVTSWVAAHPAGCVLPTPLYGRSAELLAIVPGRVALARGMRDALGAQLADERWLMKDSSRALRERLDAAQDWDEGMALPRAALLCHDAMGLVGPSRLILESAAAAGHPILFTGHLPAGSPGERLVSERRATWIRLPTHPTLSENLAIAASSGAKTVLGHSCDARVLKRLARHLPSLLTDVATGAFVDI